MDASRKLAMLIDLTESVGITIRKKPVPENPSAHHPDSAGTLVRLKGKEILFLDESAPAAEQIAALARALCNREQIAQRFIPPEIRSLIERANDE